MEPENREKGKPRFLLKELGKGKTERKPDRENREQYMHQSAEVKRIERHTDRKNKLWDRS